MRASTYAIVTGVWTFIVGPVCIVAPTAFLTNVQRPVGDVSLVQVVSLAWIVVSISVVARARVSELFVERFIRAIAWLILCKSLLALCWPRLVTWSWEFYSEVPFLVRCLGAVNLLFGLWMFSLAKSMKHVPAESSKQPPNDAKARRADRQ